MINANNFTLFVSYSRNDKELVVLLANELQNKGINVIYDETVLKPVEEWQKRLQKALMNADGVLILITPENVSSQFVIYEIGIARSFFDNGEKLVLPVIYKDTKPPEIINDIYAIHWGENFQEVIDRIIEAVYSFKPGKTGITETRGVTNTDRERELKSKSNQRGVVTQNIIEEAIRVKGEEWKKTYPNVTGFSVGNKISYGKDTGITALIFIVSKKVRPPKSGMIPTSVKYSSPSDGKEYMIPTDVIESADEMPGENQIEKKIPEKDQGIKPAVFVSYDHENDTEYFKQLKELLSDFEVNTFDYSFDRFGIKGNTKELETKVVNSQMFISLYSNSYPRNRFLIRQLDLATELKKPILVIKTGEDVIVNEEYSQNQIILFGKENILIALSRNQKSAGNKNKKPGRKNKLAKEEKKSFLPFFLTEGNHRDTDDQLDFENDIDSFASLISLERVNPPLAIGLFGNWGSGKSFFMEKLSERIEEIVRLEDPDFVQNVVHVKYNSWHYSDTNLWASLITEIFDSLKIYAKKQNQESEIHKLQRTLKTTILERKVIEEKRKKLETSVKELEFEQLQKRSRLEDISGIKLLKLILSDKRINKDLAELKNENIEAILENKKNVDQYIAELKDTGNKTVFFFRELLNLKGWRWILIIIIAIIAFISVPLLKNIFPADWEKFTLQIRAFTSVTAIFLAKLIATIKPYTTALRDALSRLQSLKETIESREKKDNSQLTHEQSELTELKTSLAELDTKITDTKESINDILSGRQLLKFIEERTRDEKYSSALGVISWVRKDFITLDKLLREQHSISEEEKREIFNPEDVQLKIDRIVLYIDDLDRCNEDVVVKVLEAIHLLLAFPLFVVVVGVDPRWLNNALSEKYKKLFGYKEEDNHEALLSKSEVTRQSYQEIILKEGIATSYDYLEKIFQIPFALKPINKTGRDKLLKYLIRKEMTDIPDPTIPKQTVLPPKNQDKQKMDAVKTQPSGTVQKAELSVKVSEEVKLEKVKKAKARLIFSNSELEYMQKISPLFGKTPRSINRYVNIYRIIKSHGNLQVEGEYSEEEFRPIMFLLGVIVGYSSYAKDFIDKVMISNDSQTFGKLLEDNGLDEKLKEHLMPFVFEIKNFQMKDFKSNIELISRFSFRTLLAET
jgi:hypothetical protein